MAEGKKFELFKARPSRTVEVEVNEELNHAVAEYVAAKRAIEAAENTMKTWRPVIEAALHASGGATKVGKFKLSLVECEREVFALAKAKLKIDMRKLRPYISTVAYTQIRVKE